MRRLSFLFVGLAAACSSFGSEGAPAPEDGEKPPTDGGTGVADDSERDGGPVTTEDAGSVDAALDGPDLTSKHLAFVTSGLYTGALALPAYGSADDSAPCQQAVDGALKSGRKVFQGHGRFQLVIAGPSRSDAFAPLSGTYGWFRVDGTPVFNPRPSAITGPAVPLLTELGAPLLAGQIVWTGGALGAQPNDQDCIDWTWQPADGAKGGTVGSATATDASWWTGKLASCTEKAHLYCFEVDTN